LTIKTKGSSRRLNRQVSGGSISGPLRVPKDGGAQKLHETQQSAHNPKSGPEVKNGMVGE